ncbi:MAG: helix-turn-helix transcriptional regulator [Candidatus Moraniibacteriota bacterium]
MGSTIRTKEYALFIERMKKARAESGLLQIEVAKAMKRPQSYVSRVESGEYRLDILEVKKFAKLYKQSIDYFLK